MPSLFVLTEPRARLETPNLTPPSNNPLTMLPEGVFKILALPWKLLPRCSIDSMMCVILSRFISVPSGVIIHPRHDSITRTH